MNNLRMFLWMTFLLGLVYPLIITAFAHIAVNHKASGSLIIANGKPVGSQLIAQKFENKRYFWPRPSYNDYSLPSGGSNLGTTSIELKKLVQGRKEYFTTIHGPKKIPSELLYASGSGLDPHLTPEGAIYQIERISQSRGIDPKKVKELIDKHICWRYMGFLGENCVNVLELNLALDEIK